MQRSQACAALPADRCVSAQSACGLAKARYEQGVNGGGNFMCSGVIARVGCRVVHKAYRCCGRGGAWGIRRASSSGVLLHVHYGDFKLLLHDGCSFNHWHTRQFAAYALREAHVNARRGIPDKKCPGSPKSLCILPGCAGRMADAGPLPKLSGRCVQRAALLQSCACPFFNGTMLWRVDLRRARGFGLRWFVRGFFKGGRGPPPPEQGQQGDEARSFCKLSRSDCADAPPKGHA